MSTRPRTAALLACLAAAAVVLGLVVWLVSDHLLLGALVASQVVVVGMLVLVLRHLGAHDARARRTAAVVEGIPAKVVAARKGTVEGVRASLTEPGGPLERTVRLAVDAALAAEHRARAEERRTAAVRTEGQIQADIWSTVNLLRLLDVDQEIPPPGGFAATPTTLLALVALVLRHEGPGPLVVEAGSGTSTVWIALALRTRGDGRVVAIEHDEHYAEQTRQALRRSGLQDWAEVRVAPLVDLPADDVEAAGAGVAAADGTPETLRWYDPAACADLTDVDLFFVDGPPGHTGRGATMGARYPALGVMGARLRDGGTVVLDDIGRPHEQAALDRWTTRPTAGRRLATVRDTDRARVFRVVADDESPQVTPGA